MKSALAFATPLAFLAVRFGIATLLLVPGTRFTPRFTGRELAGGLLLAGIVSVGFVMQTVGLVITTPARSAFIVAIASVLAPVVALVFLGQRTRWLTAGALAFAFAGMYLLTAPDTGGLNRGDALTLVCAVLFGGQIVAVTELAARYDARRLVWMQSAGTAVVSGVAVLLFEQPRISWTPGFIGALAYTVVFASAIAFLLQMRAQRHMTSARAALIFCLEPVFAAVTSWLVLGERLAATQWAGGALILVGMVVADLPVARHTAPAKLSVHQ